MIAMPPIHMLFGHANRDSRIETWKILLSVYRFLVLEYSLGKMRR